MYLYLRLLQYFPSTILFGSGHAPPPPGFSLVITSRAFVVTGRGTRVIAKQY